MWKKKEKELKDDVATKQPVSNPENKNDQQNVIGCLYDWAHTQEQEKSAQE